ncbi:MAG: hypothetical protein GQ544_05320, partial [Candidatus Aminicenantes bacterium]|nr:hypothetical protein [Candidatus Aminicenantes bacterium]
MAKEFKFPDIGEGITEGEIVKWLVKERDTVEEDQTLAEVETDKAIVEVPSPYAGTVLKLHFKEKDIVKVGQTLVTIGETGESLTEAAPSVTGKPAPAAPEPEKQAPTVVGQIKDTSQEIRDIQSTPKVRRLAIQLGIDIKTIAGSGPAGRITEEDIQSAAATKAPEAPQTPTIKVKSKYDFYGTLNRIRLRGVRRATARKMAESIANAAHVTHFDEADVTALAALRKQIKPEAEQKGVKLTYLPFVIKALVKALMLHPTLNSILDMEEEEIIVKEYYNIGVAIDVPDGLIVPVIKFADQKTLFELAEEIVNLADAAK